MILNHLWLRPGSLPWWICHKPYYAPTRPGMPLEWVDFRQAVGMYCRGEVAYSCGNPLFQIRGGINARTQRRSLVEVNSIIATYSHGHALAKLQRNYVPPLSNRTLFQRDDHLCLYCGERFPNQMLSRIMCGP